MNRINPRNLPRYLKQRKGKWKGRSIVITEYGWEVLKRLDEGTYVAIPSRTPKSRGRAMRKHG